jgi:hypothetical protein
VSLPIRSDGAWLLGRGRSDGGGVTFSGGEWLDHLTHAPVSPSQFGLHRDEEQPSDYPQRAAVSSRDGDGVKDVPPRERAEPAEFSSTWMRSNMAWTRPTFFLATSTAEAS